MPQDTRIGTTVAGYRIERLLGRGGMGRVYLAEDTRLGRKVALKLLDPDLAEDERFRERFARESRLAASLDHPNVVPIYEAGDQEDVLLIAMRYVEGTDLARLIEEQGPLPLDRTAAILAQVASALDAAHELGLIHRDVKPGNILLDSDGHVYITDFGLMKDREASVLTRPAPDSTKWSSKTMTPRARSPSSRSRASSRARSLTAAASISPCPMQP